MSPRIALAWLAVLIGLALVPTVRGVVDFPTLYLTFAATVLFWAALATSWNVLSGYSGYFSFGQGAFFGVGTYTTAVLAGRHGFDVFLTIPIAVGLGGCLALAIGALAFRLRSLRGEIFALLTLAVPFILAALARFTSAIDGGQGIILTVPSLPDFIGGFQDLVYLISLLLGWGAVAIAFTMQRSRLGWALFSIRDAEDVAEGLGVPTFRFKMIAIAITGMLAAAAGSVFAIQVGFVTVENSFGLTVPLFVIVMSVLGGRFSWIGPAVGALVIVTLRDWLSAQGFEGWNLVILGAILAVLILVAPDGIVARVRVRPVATLAAFGLTLVATAVLTAIGIGPFADLETLDWFAAALTVAGVVAFWPRRSTAPARTVETATPAPAPHPTVSGEAASPSDAAVPVAPTAHGGPEPGAPIIEVDGVEKHFGGLKALRGVNLTVSEGELVGLVGPNGSGKTTLISLIAGTLSPTAGTIRVGGVETNRVEPHDIAHLGIARTYQIPRPFGTMTVRDNVAMALMFGREPMTLGEARRAAEAHLDLVGLAPLADALPASVNLHERQLLEMARAIATRPRVLLLDEALAGLNPAEVDNAVEVVRRIHRSGIAIVLVEHLLRVVNQLATRIVVLDQGTLLAEGAPEAVMSNPAVVSAYLGSRAHA